MIKRVITLMALILALSVPALAEDAIAELRDIRKSAEDAIAEIQAPEVTPTPEPPEPTPSPTPDETVYEPLQNGARGENVVKLQERLKVLGYLDGSADGIYGNKTAEAVKAFQRAAGLAQTGNADAETQRALYNYVVPAGAAVSYEQFDYKKLGQGAGLVNHRVTLSGRVMQVLTDDTYADTAGVYTVMRVATRGKCYDVVYVSAFRPADAPALSEGATVAVWGTVVEPVLYMSVSNQYVRLPRVDASTILITG